MMNDISHELAGALHERLAIIQNREAYDRDPAAHLEQLKMISAKIAGLQHQLPQPVDPQLQHFLERCSYDKALAHLEQLIVKQN
jgi:hypothetical protein